MRGRPRARVCMWNMIIIINYILIGGPVINENVDTQPTNTVRHNAIPQSSSTESAVERNVSSNFKLNRDDDQSPRIVRSSQSGRDHVKRNWPQLKCIGRTPNSKTKTAFSPIIIVVFQWRVLHELDLAKYCTARCGRNVFVFYCGLKRPSQRLPYERYIGISTYRWSRSLAQHTSVRERAPSRHHVHSTHTQAHTQSHRVTPVYTLLAQFVTSAHELCAKCAQSLHSIYSG